MIAELVSLGAVLLFTGAIAGLIAGLLGVGGGIVIVPVLFYLFPLVDVDEGVRMHLAVGTSLATIIATSFVSARAHYRRKAIDTTLLRTLGPWIFLGVIVGTVVGGLVGGAALTMTFAVVALVVALNMAMRPENFTLAEELPAAPLRQAIAAGIGGFSVIMGIGGGTLSVPILTLFGLAIRRAVATAAAIGLIIAIPGAIGFVVAGLGDARVPPASLGYANLIGFALIVPTSTLLAPVGARLAHTISPRLLRYVFAGFLAITSVRMAYSVLG